MHALTISSPKGAIVLVWNEVYYIIILARNNIFIKLPFLHIYFKILLAFH